MSQPFKLFRLQQMDTQLDQGHARLKEIDLILSNDENLRSAQATADETKLAFEEAQKILRRAEEEVRSQRVKIEQCESTLYGGRVTNPKELQDLQNESAALKRYLSVLEDRQLEAMITLDDREADFEKAGRELEDVKNRLAVDHQSLHAEQESLQNEISRLEKERQAAASTIPADEINLYNQLRQQRRGIAVAKVVDKTCAACGSTLTPALIQSARSSGPLNRCSFCGRILYAG